MIVLADAVVQKKAVTAKAAKSAAISAAAPGVDPIAFQKAESAGLKSNVQVPLPAEAGAGGEPAADVPAPDAAQAQDAPPDVAGADDETSGAGAMTLDEKTGKLTLHCFAGHTFFRTFQGPQNLVPGHVYNLGDVTYDIFNGMLMLNFKVRRRRPAPG